MTLDQAEDLAARTLAAIDAAYRGCPPTLPDYAADRERVQSDLAGLQQHVYSPIHGVCRCQPLGADQPCPDARRYADGLRRTAALYGVTE